MIPKKLQQTLLITATVYLALLPTSWATAARSIAFGVSVGLVLVTIAVDDRGRPESLRSPGTAILVTLGAWAASAMASVAWSVDPTYSASELRVELAWGVATMAIFYVATRDRKAWITSLSALLASFALLAVLAILLAVSPAGWDPQRLHVGVGAFSTYCVLVAPFLFALLAPPPIGLRRRNLSMLVAAALLALLLVVARLSENRMVWLALASVFATGFALGAIRWRVRLRWSALRWVTPLLALFLVLGLLFADVARERARENSPFQGGVVQSFTADPRVALWEVTAEWIGDRPWVGYGFGKLILHDQIAGALHDVTLTHAHNLFASQWLQLGAVGLAAFVALLAALAWRFVRFLRGPDDALALLGLIGISMLVGFIVKNLTDDFLFRSNAKEFWALTAMLLGYGVRMEQDRVRCLSSDAIGPTLPHRR